MSSLLCSRTARCVDEGRTGILLRDHENGNKENFLNRNLGGVVKS